MMYEPFGQRAPPPGDDRMFLVASAIPSRAPSSRAQAPIAPSHLARQTSQNAPKFQEQGSLPRIVPLKRDATQEGVIFAHTRDHEYLIVYRTEEEKLKSPERLNLDRRQLTHCPVLYNEQRLRLLNYQHNAITAIRNVDNLPNLIFLDVYNNKITSLEGSLSCLSGLRVFMAGKNRITRISNLDTLKKLDVLDFHSNEIHRVENLDSLVELRVLNLAGNRIRHATNLSSLRSLTELNLRRNRILQVDGLDALESLQRVFFSHNQLASLSSIQCMFGMKQLQELSLDGNPLSEGDTDAYRRSIASAIPTLKHLDLKPVSLQERVPATLLATDANMEPEREAVDSKEDAVLSATITTSVSTAGDPGLHDAVEPNALAACYAGSAPCCELLASRTVPGQTVLVLRGEAWGWTQHKKSIAAIVECRVMELSIPQFVAGVTSTRGKLSSLSTLHFQDCISCTRIADMMELARCLPQLRQLTLQPPLRASGAPFLMWLLPSVFPMLESLNGVPVTVIDRLRGQQLFHPLFAAGATVLGGGGGVEDAQTGSHAQAAEDARACRERVVSFVQTEHTQRVRFDELWQKETMRRIQEAVAAVTQKGS